MNNKTNENKQLDELLSIDEIKKDIEDYFNSNYVSDIDSEELFDKINALPTEEEIEEILSFFVNELINSSEKHIDEIKDNTYKINVEDILKNIIQDIKETSVLNSDKIDKIIEDTNFYNRFKTIIESSQNEDQSLENLMSDIKETISSDEEKKVIDNTENYNTNDISDEEILRDEDETLENLMSDIKETISLDEEEIVIDNAENYNTNDISNEEILQNEDESLENLMSNIKETISLDDKKIEISNDASSELYNIIEMIEEDPLRNEVIDKIKELDNYEEKIGIFNMYVLKLKDIIKERNLDELGIERRINNTREILKDYGNLSDSEIDSIFKNSEFNVESILNDINKENDFILNDSEIKEALTNEDEQIISYNKVQMIKELEEFGIDELHNREEFINCYEKLNNDINKVKNEKIANVKLIDKQLNDLKKQIENLEKNKYKDLTFKELLKLYQEIYIEKAEKQSKNEKIDEVEFKLKEVSDEINRTLTNPKTKEQLEKEYEKLVKQQKQLQSSYDKKIDNLIKKQEKLSNLFNILTGLELDEITKEYNDNKSKISNKNPEIKATDIKTQDEPQVKKIISKVKNNKLLYKGLAGVAGFGAGFVLASVVPGAGRKRMAIAVVKLVISVSTKKFPNGPITKIVDTASLKINNAGEKFKNSNIGKSKIATGAINAVGKIKKFAQSEEGQWFINGVAAGYVAGNIIEYFKDITPDKVTSATESTSSTLETEPILEETNIPETLESEVETVLETENIDNILGDVEQIIDPSKIGIKAGDILDISELEYGFSSSTSNDAVHLMTEIGKNVEVDKLNFEGNMVHFKQLNGEGYAWFKLSDVQEVLAKAAKSSGRKL